MLAACSSSQVSIPDAGFEVVAPSTGPVAFAVADSAAAMGFMFPRPSVAVSSSAVTVHDKRYGSLCQLDLAASASVTGSVIALHVKFAERLTSCVAEVRALSYTARISAAPGSYDLIVIHDQNNAADTVLTQKVLIPK